MERINDDKKSLEVLKEQLARQKGILANSNLLRTLPDKGKKVKESVMKLEAELNRRNEEIVTRETTVKSVPDVAKLEWGLRTANLSAASSSSSSFDALRFQENVSSTDNKEKNEKHTDNDEIFKIIATSQITQRQVVAKPVVGSKESRVIDVKPDPYLASLVEKDLRKKSTESKFLPSKTTKTKHNEGTSPESGTLKGSISSCNNKWDEALLPRKSSFDCLKPLSMEDTIKISCEKYKLAEVLKDTTPQKKKSYAYDKLINQGLDGSSTLTMQTSRPIKSHSEAGEDFEDDLSHDSMTEESESDISDNDDEYDKDKTKSNAQTGKDLSGLLNASLKLNM